MNLTAPPLVKATPGDPILSQQWNNIIDAIKLIIDALDKNLGALDVTVKDRANGNPIPGAVVSIVPGDASQGPARPAEFIGGSLKLYRASQLPAGPYTVTVEAAGYNTETRNVTMDNAGTSQALVVDMTATQALVTVPSLLGRVVNDAIAIIGSDLQLTRVIDSHGNDIPPGALTDDATKALILNQSPLPNASVAKNSPLFLHISAKAEFTARVKVPDIRGLTIDQARAALEGSQLVLGEVTNS
jgi:hypothetical protein